MKDIRKLKDRDQLIHEIVSEADRKGEKGCFCIRSMVRDGHKVSESGIAQNVYPTVRLLSVLRYFQSHNSSLVIIPQSFSIYKAMRFSFAYKYNLFLLSTLSEVLN